MHKIILNGLSRWDPKIPGRDSRSDFIFANAFILLSHERLCKHFLKEQRKQRGASLLILMQNQVPDSVLIWR